MTRQTENQNNATRHSGIFRFANPALARSFADRAEKAMGILYGDDGRFWVATLATCSRLEKAGYEWARIA